MSVFVIGIMITAIATQGWVTRRRYDRHHDTKPSEMAITRWGFFLPQLKVSVVLCALGLLLIIVGGVGAVL